MSRGEDGVKGHRGQSGGCDQMGKVGKNQSEMIVQMKYKQAQIISSSINQKHSSMKSKHDSGNK